MRLFYVNTADEKREKESLRADTKDKKVPNAKKKRKIQGDAIGTGIRGSKKEKRTVMKTKEEAREEVRGRKVKRGRSGSKRHCEIEEKREGPRRAEEGIDHSFSFWLA